MVNCGIKPRDLDGQERLVPDLSTLVASNDPIFERVEADPATNPFELGEWWRKYELDIPDGKGNKPPTPCCHSSR